MTLIHLAKKICLHLLLPFALSLLVLSNVYARDVALQWNANTEEDLAGYKLHYGTTSGLHPITIDVGNVTTYTIDGLQEKPVVYYFVATAYNTRGEQSEKSLEVNTVDDEPEPLPTQASNFVYTVECREDVEPFELVFEAENASLSVSVQIGTDTDGVKYVFSAIGDQGYIVFTFDIPTSGKYLIDALVNSRGMDYQDSFYVGFLTEAEIRASSYNIYDTTRNVGFIWDEVSLRGETGTFETSNYDPMIWELAEGNNRLIFAARESNTWLDKIRIRKKE